MATLITAMIDSVTRNYIHNKAPQSIYDARALTKELKKRGAIEFMGGPNHYYPLVASALADNTGATNGMWNGAVGETLTPAIVDSLNALHQDGFAYFHKEVYLSSQEWAENTAGSAKNERAIDLALMKEDLHMGDIADLIEYNLIKATGTNSTVGTGLAKLMDITNTDYGGINFTSDTTNRPEVVTIATADFSTGLTISDLLEAYENIEDESRYPDAIFCHPEVITRMRSLAWTATDLTPGTKVDWAHKDHSLLGAPFVPSRYMPSGSSGRIYLLNFGNDEPVSGGSDKVGHGNFFHLQMAGTAPGFKTGPWEDWQTEAGTIAKCSVGAFNFICNNPAVQAYIKVT